MMMVDDWTGSDCVRLRHCLEELHTVCINTARKWLRARGWLRIPINLGLLDCEGGVSIFQPQLNRYQGVLTGMTWHLWLPALLRLGQNHQRPMGAGLTACSSPLYFQVLVRVCYLTYVALSSFKGLVRQYSSPHDGIHWHGGCSSGYCGQDQKRAMEEHLTISKIPLMRKQGRKH